MDGRNYMLEPLTQREAEILHLLADGLSNREIAQALVIAPGTVKWYNKQLFSKLGVHSRSQAVDRAREMGLLEDAGTTSPKAMPQLALPSGIVTFLFTDIEGSTQLWDTLPDAMRFSLERHNTIINKAITAHCGQVYKVIGDSFQAAFVKPAQTVEAAVAAQCALNKASWGETGPLRVRMGIHTGEAEAQGDDYATTHTLNRVARIMSAAHGGQILISQAVVDLLHGVLPSGVTLRDMGQHHLKGLRQVEHLYQVVQEDLPQDFPPLVTLDETPNNLPIHLTSFVGRESEIAEVKRLLETTRLLTLTGPPGTGKTRLGLQVAAEVLDQFTDGVYFVELAPISDPALVLSTISQLFGVREASGQPLVNTLQIYLRDKHLLLVIDNFEQVIEAAPLVGDLLSAAPDLKVLVTSREALRVYGEQEYTVPPLRLPDPEGIVSLQALGKFEAVDLFVQRARAVKPDLELTDENALAVAEICVRLDGLPLAIELAAARSKLLSPENICTRLESRLLTSTGGARDLPIRQQTLRAAVDWSYDLLDPAEKTLFTRLAVFQGGRSLEAVETVCRLDLAINVLEGLESLLNKSLLRKVVGFDGEPRFVMLEMLHEYARERLHESGEAEDLQRLHAEYFLTLAERAALEMRKAGFVYWSLRLREEHNNLRTALTWSLSGGDAELGLRLAGALRDFWHYEGHSAEGLVWIQRALEKAGEVPLAIRARALNAAGWLSFELCEHEQGKIYNSQALMCFRKLGDEANTAWALAFLSTQYLALQGGLKEAISLCEEGLALFRRLDDKPGITFAYNTLGELSRMDGDYDRAGKAYKESLAIAREEGDKLRQALPLHNLGYVAQQAGDYKRAEAAMLEGLALLMELENTRYIPQDLAALAGPVAAQGDTVKAARLLGASEALLEKMGLVPQVADRVEIERNLSAVREHLDEAALETAWSQGRAMSLEKAVAYALGEDFDTIA